ncbi:hypothetical protein HMPREF2532_05140 [Bacteroides ovatus]|uniref:Uncharacterized protein n=1 Tax=Bacteroides ovatus (strain ATCC 8483 / DSM 1896 / JCM 5824 / BCRC 10623 / CCUG 4943 / NCTC 11153) TaxID=411476 RepID=A0AAN3D588_BACO1|nr:hypothetical protein BACOVA_04435 [Bacteroides ovatus ATCC 8483]EEZ01939.1 hypothetical protein HMPREF0102_04347 [Bacteroides sp. 2_1_22]KXT39875.1 hypothetical protein HMPREF2532_05140 [Bacteroides ovatus]
MFFITAIVLSSLRSETIKRHKKGCYQCSNRSSLFLLFME